MEKVAAFHELNYKKKVEVLAQVPGVVTLMGAFSDFCNGYCIAGTGALGLRVAMSARDDNLVRVYDATKSDKKHFNLNSLKYRKEDRWANYVKAVFSILSEEGVTFPHGFDITLKGALLFQSFRKFRKFAVAVRVELPVAVCRPGNSCFSA